MRDVTLDSLLAWEKLKARARPSARGAPGSAAGAGGAQGTSRVAAKAEETLPRNRSMEDRENSSSRPEGERAARPCTAPPARCFRTTPGRRS